MWGWREQIPWRKNKKHRPTHAPRSRGRLQRYGIVFQGIRIGQRHEGSSIGCKVSKTRDSPNEPAPLPTCTRPFPSLTISHKKNELRDSNHLLSHLHRETL